MVPGSMCGQNTLYIHEQIQMFKEYLPAESLATFHRLLECRHGYGRTVERMGGQGSVTTQ